MSEGVTLVMATGVQGNTSLENILNGALEANTRDLLDLSSSISTIDRRIMLTNSEKLTSFCFAKYPEVSVETTSDEFHFGESLFRTIKDYTIENLLYMGGGSGPLLEKEDLERITSFLVERSGCLLANNFYSADMIGISPARKLLKLKPPEKDNSLGWLARDAGLEPHEMTRNAKTQLDLDTPVDLIPMKLSGRGRTELEKYMRSLDYSGTRIEEILPQFTDEDSRVVIAGRLGASTWSHLEKNAACQLDVISEGRGKYAGQGDGTRSYWLGKCLEDLGPKNLVKALSEKGTGIFLDTRVLLDYKGEWPSRKDRFASDMLEPESVGVDYLKDLTRSARSCSKPVVLGGHSMISGSLYLLTEVAWQLSEPKSVNVRPKIFDIEDKA